jgi:formamidopyrimidine-DNA glycosylase
LHRSGVSPLRVAGGIGAPRVAKLAGAIRETLEEAIAAGGSSLRDFRRADGELGYFQHAFRVYGRSEAACLSDGCGGVVRRVVQSGRSSFFCATCQR